MLVHGLMVSTSCVQGVSGFRFVCGWVGGWDEEGSRVFLRFCFFSRFWFLGRLCLWGGWVLSLWLKKNKKTRKAKREKKKTKEKRKGKGKIKNDERKKKRNMSKRTSRDSRASRVEPEEGPNTFTQWNGHFDRGEKATALETKQQANSRQPGIFLEASIAQTLSSYRFAWRQNAVTSRALSMFVRQSCTTSASETSRKLQVVFRRALDWESVCSKWWCFIYCSDIGHFPSVLRRIRNCQSS